MYYKSPKIVYRIEVMDAFTFFEVPKPYKITFTDGTTTWASRNSRIERGRLIDEGENAMEIKECPFCYFSATDSKDLQVLGTTFFQVKCLNCSSFGPSAVTKELAIFRWNSAPRHKTYADRVSAALGSGGK